MPHITPPGGAVSWPADEGVLGVVGVAPWATVDFCKALYQQVRAAKDWHYPRVLLDINTKLPSRGRHLQLGETDPSPAIAETIRELAANGATLAVVVCNTAHILYERWSRDLPIPVLNIVDETVRAARTAGARRIAVLASQSLAASGLYSSAARAAGLDVLELPPALQSDVNALIEAIKQTGGTGAGGEAQVGRLAAHLRAGGADTAILGCTELSLLQEPLLGLGVVAIDSNQALARAALLGIGLREPIAPA